MALRLVITDAVWAALEPLWRSVKPDAGSPPQLHDRRFIEAGLYPARTGMPWRDVPDEFGQWDAVYHRCRRWKARHIWRHLWQRVQPHGCALAHQVCIDATIMRAQQHAAGARKPTVAKTPRLWAALGAALPPHDMPPAPMNIRASA